MFRTAAVGAALLALVGLSACTGPSCGNPFFWWLQPPAYGPPLEAPLVDVERTSVEISPGDVPPAPITSIQELIPGWKLERAWQVVEWGRERYELEGHADGVVYRYTLSPEGTNISLESSR